MEDQKLFLEDIERLQTRFAWLHERWEQNPDQGPSLFAEAVEDLRITLEELMVAEAELLQQSDDLVAARFTLEAERQRYREFFEFAPDGYLVTDLYSKILEANRSAALLLNVPQVFLPGNLLVQFIEKKGRQGFRESLNRLRLREAELLDSASPPTGLDQVHEWEFRLQPRGRQPFFAALHVAVFRQGEESTLRWSLRNITEWQEAENVKKALLRWLLNLQEEERRKISRELHDQLGQELTALTLGLKALEVHLPQGSPGFQLLKRLQNATGDLGQEIHRVAVDLRPSSLDDLGLRSALNILVEEWSERSHIEVDFAVTGLVDEPVPSDLATTVYRIVQESFNNILRHAQASRVSLILDRRSDQLRLVVEDNGIGFDVEQVVRNTEGSRSLGLFGMQERAEMANGTLTIESESGKGTTIYLYLPIKN